jgi:hypothetical protein
MIDPGTASLIASAVSLAGQGVGGLLGSKKAKKTANLRSKEMKRETRAGLLQDAQQRASDLEQHRLESRSRSRKRSAQSMQDTADLVRGAFNI